MKTFEWYVPAGWLRVDLTGDTTAAVSRAVEHLTVSAPPEQRALAKTFLRDRLTTVVAELSEGGAVCIVLPIDPVADMPIRPMIVAMPLTVPGGTEPMDLLLATASADATAEVIDVDGLVALRTRTSDDRSDDYTAAVREAATVFGQSSEVAAGDLAVSLEEVRTTATRVRYLVGDPADRERWIDLFFTVEHPEHPVVREVVDAAVALFDAQVQTFRWTA